MKVSELNKAVEVAEGKKVTKAEKRFSKAERLMLASADKYEPAAPSNWASAPDSISAAIDAIAAAYPVGSAGAAGSAKTISALYDYSLQGGTGPVALGVSLPAKAIVVEVIQDVLVAMTGATGSVLSAGGVTLSPSVHDDALGVTSTGPALASAKSGAGGELSLAITGTATAGKVRWFVRYVISE